MANSPGTRRLAGTPFLEDGAGVPVVLVHGAVCDHRIWQAQRAFIASRWRYIALDLHYHGPWPWPDDGIHYALVDHVAQVREFLQALAAGPVHLVGQSYGGHLALRLALDHPELVRSLVLQEPAVESLVDGPQAKDILDERQRAFAPAGAALREGRPVEAAQLLVEALINQGPGTFQAAPDDLKAMVRDNARTLPLLFKAPAPPPLTCARVGQLQKPTLILNGAGTMRYYACIGERLAACIPGARREVVDGASHGIETQAPAAWAQLVREFLDDAAVTHR